MQTLWILFYRVSNDADTLFPFYARDREHAEQQAEEILQEYPYERIELKPFPEGFVMNRTRIPGTIEADRVE